MDEIEARVKDEFDKLEAKLRRYSETPVDVQTEDDSELDSHLWTLIGETAGEADRESVQEMTPDVRAYFLTRLFEWSTANDGADAFPTYYPHLLDMLPEVYRHLGMDETAQIAERFVVAPATKRLAADEEYEPTDGELEELNELADGIGMNDTARLAFVRAHPDSFALADDQNH